MNQFRMPQKNQRLIVHELEDEVLLYDPQIDRSHRLNVSAAFIWRHCDGQRDCQSIAQLLTERFDVDFDVACRDTRYAIDQLVGEQVLSYSLS